MKITFNNSEGNYDTSFQNVEIYNKKKLDKIEENIINIFPEKKRQKISGFGVALTASSGYTLGEMEAYQAEDVLNSYFSLSKGMGMEYVRLCIDSSDFSPYMYEASSNEECIKRGELSFEFEERFIIPWLEKIREINPSVKILFSPWSPPAFMKDNKERSHGGKLKKEYYSLWAEYVASFIEEYKKRGFNVWALTLQNEPNAVQTWDSCIYSAEEEIDLLQHICSSLLNHSLSFLNVFLWDHNKERILQRSEVYSSTPYFYKAKGIAFHGYCGDHFEALSLMRENYPEKELFLSEFCINIKEKNNYKRQLEKYGHEYLNDLRFGSSALIEWNLVLNEEGGPNHVQNFCLAPVIYDRVEKTIEKNMCFSLLFHIAKSLRPNTRIVASSSYDSSLDYVAGVDERGKVVLIISNPGKRRKVNIRMKDRVFLVDLEKETINTIEVEAKEYE